MVRHPRDDERSRARLAAVSGGTVRIDASRFDAAVFDLDGVLTSTAAQHARAWKRLFDEFLRTRAEEAGAEFHPFHERDDYLRYVDGKPRYDGVEAFLAARGITLPRGTPSDPPGYGTVCALGNRKDAYYHELIRGEGVHVYQSSSDLLEAFRNAGCLTALISASRNTMEVIEAARLAERFDAIVDGIRAEALGLAGKPAPDVFLQAVADLGVEPDRAIVFEDAEAGVSAARAGRFGLVVGVERTGHAGRLEGHGAHVEVADLRPVTVDGAARPRPGGTLPSAFGQIEAILWRARGRRIAVFLDYDGTLTPIVDRPELATLSDEMRSAMRQLAGTALVGIVSGRDLADVVAMVGIDGILYAGSHGFQLRDADGHEEVAADAQPYRADLVAAADEVDRAISNIDGAFMERKGFAIAAHYRLVAAAKQEEVRSRVERIAAGYPRLRVTGGKMVIELRPDLHWDKGQAILALIERWGVRDLFPVYLGDDETDEDAFRALRGRGTGILVGDAPTTQAIYQLAGVEEVQRWLNSLHEHLAGAAQ
jgi:trehalose-phosphatase